MRRLGDGGIGLSWLNDGWLAGSKCTVGDDAVGG